MVRARTLWGAVAVAAGLTLGEPPAWALEPALVFASDDPGPRLPPIGRSLFDELFAGDGGYDIPYPFARLLEAVNARIAPARARTALIPLGRSLQRFAAHPDHFDSPRLIVAVDSEGAAAIDQPLMKDRLYIGFQPAAQVIEVISYNEAGGRFEFQVVSDYGALASPGVEYTERSICVACHQGHGPIFSRPLWSETNANPKIAGRLAKLGEVFHGAAVRQGIDGPDAFDRSTDRANRIALANRLWKEACGEGAQGTRCRAELLRAALSYRLGGARAGWAPHAQAKMAASLQERVSSLWPGGLGLPSPDLPNRDPLVELAAARPLGEILDAPGPANPEVSRAALLQWLAPAAAVETLASLAREIAAMFAASDIAWLDTQLAILGPVSGTHHSASCRLDRIERRPKVEELRLGCGQAGGGLALRGFVTVTASREIDGRIDELSLGQAPALQRLRAAGGKVTGSEGGETLQITLRENGAGLSARLASGERLSKLTVRIQNSADATAEIAIVDDIGVLDAAIASLADAASDALGPGPLRRRAVLAELDRALSGP